MFEKLIPTSKKSALLLVFVAILAGTIPAIVASFVVSSTTTSSRVAAAKRDERRRYTSVCERTNISKAEARIAVHENTASPPSLVRRRDKLFVVLDCRATFNATGSAVPLSPQQDRRYLEIIRRDGLKGQGSARVPIVRNGQVVGSRVVESGKLADF
jgi:Na+-translocating ferredoxin:NAD+ oxidoreductase RnfG subunit